MSHFNLTVVVPRADDALDAVAQIPLLMDPFCVHTAVEAYDEKLDEDEAERAFAYARQHPEILPPDATIQHWTETWQRLALAAYCGGEPDDYRRDTENDCWLRRSTYNPEGRWDWYEVGGRWRGYLHLRPGLQAQPIAQARHGEGAAARSALVTEKSVALLGEPGVFGDPPGANLSGRADVARRADVDVEGMRMLAGAAADEEYDRFERATAGIEVPPTWPEIRAHYLVEQGADPAWLEQRALGLDPEQKAAIQRGMDFAREAWGNLNWVIALREAGLDPFMEDAHEYWRVGERGGRAAYVEAARRAALPTFALLLDGEWHQQGQMGMFAVVTDEKPADVWHAEFDRLFATIPDDAWLTIVDCHQ